jgi:hypothetical protein
VAKQKAFPSIEEVEHLVDEAFTPVIQQYHSAQRWLGEACVVLAHLARMRIDAAVWRWPTEEAPAIQLVVTHPELVRRAEQVANAFAQEAHFVATASAPPYPRFSLSPGCDCLAWRNTPKGPDAACLLSDETLLHLLITVDEGARHRDDFSLYVELIERLRTGHFHGDLNTLSNAGETLLHSAALNGKGELVKLLIEAGADVDALAEGGITPLMNAAVEGHDAIVAALLAAGAEVNRQSEEKVTALMETTNVRVAQQLLDAGADPDLSNHRGDTIFDIAIAQAAESTCNHEYLAFWQRLYIDRSRSHQPKGKGRNKEGPLGL